jgi:phosphinothricin acetyltransferase
MSKDHSQLQIRLACAADLDPINGIYNHYVHHSTCTYAEEDCSMDERRRWFTAHGAAHPVTVATIKGDIVGWGSLSAFHLRSAYRFTVENSVYVAPDLHRQGIGAAILRDLIDRARALGHHAIVAGIDGEQQASLALHAKHGFRRVGHLPQLGFKFGRWLDVIYMELLLSD